MKKQFIFTKDKYNEASELEKAYRLCKTDLITRSKNDELILKTVADSIGNPIPDDIKLTKMDSDEIWNYINKHLFNFIGMQKITGKLRLDFKLPIHMTLAPPNGEYQNFGLMAALDVINSVLYIKNNPPFKVSPSCKNGGGLLRSM